MKPDPAPRPTAAASPRIHVDAAGWHPSEERVSILPTLQDAIWQERRLHLTYQRSDGINVERLVDPLGLVAKGSAWYMIAAVEGEMRTYRVSRVLGARVSDQPCARPEGFDLAAYWEQSSSIFIANLPRYPATVRVAPAILPRLRYAGRFARIEQTEAPDTEGWRKVSIRFETERCVIALSAPSRPAEPDTRRSL